MTRRLADGWRLKRRRDVGERGGAPPHALIPRPRRGAGTGAGLDRGTTRGKSRDHGLLTARPHVDTHARRQRDARTLFRGPTSMPPRPVDEPERRRHVHGRRAPASRDRRPAAARLPMPTTGPVVSAAAGETAGAARFRSRRPSEAVGAATSAASAPFASPPGRATRLRQAWTRRAR